MDIIFLFCVINFKILKVKILTLTVYTQPYNYCIMAMRIYLQGVRPRTHEMAFCGPCSWPAKTFAAHAWFMLSAANFTFVQTNV